jgi:pimeloyl-ACP methyl ester carboxylesterase
MEPDKQWQQMEPFSYASIVAHHLERKHIVMSEAKLQITMTSSIGLSRRGVLRLLTTLVLSNTIFWCCDAAADSVGRKVNVGGYALWMQSRGDGSPTVVFESGGGEDSSEWSNIEPVIRERGKVRAVVYDRAGLGKSDPNPRPYRISDEGDALRRALNQFHIRGPIILVAHSYGGFISEILASKDKRVKGLVLVDANIPSFFDNKEAAVISARYTPLAVDLIQQKPELGRNLFRQDKAYPATARYMRGVHIPLNLPIIDITAEHTWVDEPDELAAMRRAHAEFVAASPKRVSIFAIGSGHYISKDRPDLVIDAVLRLISEIQEPKYGVKR